MVNKDEYWLLVTQSAAFCIRVPCTLSKFARVHFTVLRNPVTPPIPYLNPTVRASSDYTVHNQGNLTSAWCQRPTSFVLWLPQRARCYKGRLQSIYFKESANIFVVSHFRVCRNSRLCQLKQGICKTRQLEAAGSGPGPVPPPSGSVWVYAAVSNKWCPPLCRFEYTVAAYSGHWPLYANTTSPIKPEVHNVSQHRLNRTEPLICTKTWWRSAVKFWRYACGQTQTQRNKLATILHYPIGGGVINKFHWG